MALGSILAYLCKDERDHLPTRYWINRAMRADVSSTRTTTLVAGLPQTDDDEVVARLLDLNFAERD